MPESVNFAEVNVRIFSDTSGQPFKWEVKSFCHFCLFFGVVRKRGPWKMRNAELYLKEATVITPRALQPLAARLPELAPKLERLDCSNWFYSEQRREYQSKLSTSHSSGER